jgi:uncharacterized lipoprotein YddW (UPF0748 family)
MRIPAALLVIPAAVSLGQGALQPPQNPSTIDTLRPPPVTRELRGVWVATVQNMDWPSRADLSTDEQQRELIAILDRAAGLNMNAIIFQVRPEADAFYKSQMEPWSRYLTGRQGKAPDPLWDPLEFAVDEAHKRGLELHAWFNPYRAAFNREVPTAPTHITKRAPAQVRRYAQYLWLDPGLPEVRQQMIRTVVDVVKRYDIDAVHIDDYFYPYPEVQNGQRIPFPDERTYATYQRGGGTMSLGDWRRNNVNVLIREFYGAVKGEKMWVKVGISPFGIWRPGNPPSIQAGIDQYDELYADARKWLLDGSLDYIAPQLYWPVRPPEQSYPVLARWWAEQNVKGRHVWPGLALYKLPITGPRKMSANDIIEEIDTTRATPGVNGHIHFNATVLMQNVEGIADRLARAYVEPALVPASPWLDQVPPGRPIAAAARDSAVIDVRFAPDGQQRIAWWVVQARVGESWRTSILPGVERRHILQGDAAAANLVSVIAVDRSGNASIPAIVRPR